MKYKNKILIKSQNYNYSVFFNFKINSLNEKFSKNKSFFLVDQNVYKKFNLKKILRKDKTIIIKSTELNKSYLYVAKIIEMLIKKDIKRKDQIISIGGGIVQDISGFASSILFRGVNWYFIPTTILSQCDSCIGGKTSINFKNAKNQLGNFYPPRGIYLDTNFLRTLNLREIRSGLGEMTHYYLVSNLQDWNFFKKNYQKALRKNYKVIKQLIYRSLIIKKKFIEKDEFDNRERLILNYGHSFAHVLEKISNYKIPHGIAVAHGMNIANYISYKLNLISYNLFNQIETHLKIIWGNILPKKINTKLFLELLKKDKKNTKNSIRLILTKGVGKMFLYNFYNKKGIHRLVNEYYQKSLR